MAEDLKEIKKWAGSLKPKHIWVLIAIVASLYIVHKVGELNVDMGDRTNYKTVAKQFVMENAVIANKIGKVRSVSHIGVGGGAGKISYNVYNVKAEDGTGVCYVNLAKDAAGNWSVTSATIMIKGAEYTIPISRVGGR